MEGERVLSTLRIAIATVLLAAVATRSAEPPDYFVVEDLFNKHCLDCHASTEPEAKLVMESHELLMKGGESGAAIVPGKSDESLLVRLIEGNVEKDGKKKIMPPGKREKLKPDEISLIRAWIDAGARAPTETKPRELVVPKIELKLPPRKPVNAIAYAPVSNLIAVARYGEVELRSGENRAVVRTLTGHRGNVNAVAFSSDGKVLFAAGGEAGLFGEVRQWDLSDGRLFYIFEGHKDTIYSVALSPDDKTLATGSYDQKIRLWNVETGQEIKTLSGHNGCVFDLAFRRDGKLLASASADRTIKLWDVATGDRRDTLSQPLKEQYTLAFSPDGTRLAAGGVDNRIRVWQISETAAETTNPILHSRFAHEGAILQLVYSSDGKALLTSSEDRTVKLWEAGEIKETFVIDKQPDWAPALAFLAENKSFAAGRLDGTLEFYETTTGKPLAPAKPQLTRAEPRGIQRGQQTKVKLIGSHLAGLTAVKSAQPKMTAEFFADAEPKSNEVWINVSTPASLPRGSYELSVAGPHGESDRIKLHVDDIPQVYLTGTNHTVAIASLPASVWSTHEQPGAVDQVEFEATAGQTLVFDVAAKSLGSKAHAVLTLSDMEGQVLASNNGFDASTDPFLAYTFAASGRYRTRVSELELGASPEHFCRLSIGDFPFVTGFYPLSVPANMETGVDLIGYNLPADHKLTVKAEKPGELELPLDLERFRTRRSFKLIVGDGAEFLETEPNDAPEHATKLQVPCVVGGRIWSSPLPRERENRRPPPELSSDADLFRFDAKAGQTWVIETQAAGRGSPMDTKIEVLHPDGKAVQRLALQAVRDSFINFRGIDSNNPGIRLENWEEMELNEFVYLNGEVIRIFRMPQGPDSDMLFYTSAGKRRSYFDTSATAHALDEPAYIVEPHPPGAKLTANGLPVFPLHYANDDHGERQIGSDSRLHFIAPADGAYLVRVTDTRGFSGDAFAYRLVLREAKPDFKVTLNGGNPTVNAGSGREFSVTAERLDGFDGDIRVDIGDLPSGFSISTPLVIQAGHSEAKGTIHAALDAIKPDTAAAAASKVTATAMINGNAVTREVNNLGKIGLGEKPKLFVLFESDAPSQPAQASADSASGAEMVKPLEISVAPGQTVPAKLRIQRNGHEDLVTFTVENLPHGVIVDNIGLNGVLIPKGESEREISLTAAKWVPETDRLCYAIENQAGKQTSLPVLLKVRKAGSQIAVTAQ